MQEHIHTLQVQLFKQRHMLTAGASRAVTAALRRVRLWRVVKDVRFAQILPKVELFTYCLVQDEQNEGARHAQIGYSQIDLTFRDPVQGTSNAH